MIDIIAQRTRMRNRRKELVNKLQQLIAKEEIDSYVVALCKGRIFELEEQFFNMFPSESLTDES